MNGDILTVVARPRTVTDDEILDASMRVVMREGARAFTLAQVGAEVGLTAPGVLKRFESKRALLLALAARSRRAPGDLFAKARAEARSPLDALVRGLSRGVWGGATPRDIARSLDFLALDMADPAFNEHARAFFDAFHDAVRALLEEAIRARELRKVDAEALAGAVEVAFHGSVIAWAVHGEGAIEEALARDIGAVVAPFTTRRRGPAAPSRRALPPSSATRASRGT